MNPEIEDYIKQQLHNGFSEDQIRTRLLASGWNAEDIERAFASSKQDVALEQVKALKSTSVKGSNHMKAGIVVVLLFVVALVIGLYFFLLTSAHSNTRKPSSPQNSSASTSQPTGQSSESVLKQNADNTKRQEDISMLAAAADDYISNNEGSLPVGLVAGKSPNQVQFCGQNCKPVNNQFTTLAMYTATNIHFKNYKTGLSVPDAKTVYIVPGGVCSISNQNGLDSKTSVHSMAFLYALDFRGLEQRCVNT